MLLGFSVYAFFASWSLETYVWFQVVTGLLVAEVNVNTMSELGSGGVSLVCPHLSKPTLLSDVLL